MKFEGVSFNESFWRSKTEAEFVAHESHHGLDEKQLKEAFSIISPRKKKQAIEPTSEKSEKGEG